MMASEEAIIKLLKIRARVRLSVRRIVLELRRAYPWKQAYRTLLC